MTSAHAKPQLHGWLLALASFTGVIGFATLLLIGSVATSRGLAVEALKRNFDRDSLRGLDFFIDRALEPALFPTLNSLLEEKRAASHEVDLAKIIRELEQNKPGAASQFIGAVSIDDFTEPSGESFQKEYLSQFLSALPASITQWSADLSSLQALKGSSSEFERKYQALNEQYGLVASDFGEFMSLETESKSIESGGFYKAGVLSGLPRLKGLTDEISDLPTLREQLKTAGGEVAVEGEQAAEQFSSKIEELRNIAAEIGNDYRELNSEESGTARELEKLRKNVASGRKALIRAFGALLVFELENRVDPGSRFIASTLAGAFPSLTYFKH